MENKIKPIKNLIICNPYKQPEQHWKYNHGLKKFELKNVRRPAGFLIATKNNKMVDDPGKFQELELVNQIRKRVNDWRKNGYPNITNTTKRLLKFWNERENEENKFFFCQLEAIETLIWCTEARKHEKIGIDIPSDGSQYQRLCVKMATGTGKTVVMAMLIAWQVINKAMYPNDQRFSKNILIVAPGLTVKKRLEVLNPKTSQNYFELFRIIPDTLYEKIYEARIVVHNWHTLVPIETKKHSVVKMGPETDLAFARRILDGEGRNVVVINDEAHHAYRSILKNTNTNDKIKTTKWIEGLDKINAARSIKICYDFSATPFISTGKKAAEEMLFKWIVSDFSLNDAIESGLTKTPRIAVRDDSGEFDASYKSRFYHLYLDPEVKPNLVKNKKLEEALPDLVTNAYMLLSQDWLKRKIAWDTHNEKNKLPQIPPVMVSICNKTNTAARIKDSFIKKTIGVDELSNPEYILHIDTATLRKAEEKNESGDVSNEAEWLRIQSNTVGKAGMPGEKLRNIIAVQMINEGWDARNVTHIIGLRAFSSQLLCEQVVGRGLRRMSYEVNPETGLLNPEYVNIFGVPFTFLPHEGGNGNGGGDDITTMIEPDQEKTEHEISWPNLERINYTYTPTLKIDWKLVKTLKLRSDKISTSAGMAEVLEGKPRPDTMTYIDLEKLNKDIRLQTIIFTAAKDVYLDMRESWIANKQFLLMQIIKLTEEFIRRGKIEVVNEKNELRKRVTVLFNMHNVVRHVCDSIKEKSVLSTQILLNPQMPIKSTGMMRTWYTKKHTEFAIKNHINLAVYDNSWETATGNELERNSDVVSWVKNNHIGFIIKYTYKGIPHEYYPDFIIKLKNNIVLVLEVKGQDDDQNRTKRRYLKEWTDAVNDDGGYGTWVFDVAFHQTEVRGIISKHMKTNATAKIEARCPACRKIVVGRQEIDREFGFRVLSGIIRPQSWCKKCRSASNNR